MPENRMGVMPIGKLLARMSIPPMISMLAVAMYNLIDSLFVSMISEDAMTALALVFPLQMIMMAVSVGIGVGLTSLISRRLGERRQEDADSAATHGMVFALAIWVIFAIFGIFFAGDFLSLFTGAEGSGEIYEMALTYCRIVMIGSVSICFSIMIGKTLQATGNMFHPMLFSLVGVGTNAVLTPILVMGYLGAPQLGVAGAAYATVIGQTIELVIALYILFSRKHAVSVSFKGFRPQPETIKDILVVAAPTMVMQAVMPVLVSLLNKMLFAHGAAVFVLGVYYRLSTFTILPVVGLNQGALPIIGYSFGAGNRLRLIATYKYAVVAATIIMVIGVAIFWIFPDRIMMLFSASPETLEMGVNALRTISIAWLPAAFGIITIGLFQALAHGVFALIIAIVRQLGFILPLAYILLINFGVNGVWYSYPLAEIGALALGIIFLYRVYIKDIKGLPDGTPVGGKQCE
ncbi:MAG: MATE family efflux transporter [Clostridiales bacterium]|nr:MATE family efflux transporter [Clostridiales bacterium]